MSHSHTHGSGPRRAVGFAALLTGGFMIVEVIGGLLSGSLALLADAGHMLTDCGALTLAWFAFALARRAPDADRSYGYARFEVLAATANGLLLVLIALWIVVEALHRMSTPGHVLALPMLAVASTGLLVNLFVYRILHREADHLNVRGALLHVLGDLLGSVAAIIAALVIMTTGWTSIDPLLSLLVATLIGISAVTLLRETLHILLQGTPRELDPTHVERGLIDGIAGVLDVHHVHVWSLSQHRLVATLHLRLHPQACQQTVLREAKQALSQRFDIDHSTIQICGECCPDEVE